MFTIDAFSAASEEHPTRNEDAHFTLEQGIAGVFDGMGGYDGSEDASRFVAEFCADALQNESTATPPEAMRIRLQYVLEQAQEAFMETYRTRTQRIGTTAILASIVTDPESNVPYACFAYAGDSRGHIYRNDKLYSPRSITGLAATCHSMSSEKYKTNSLLHCIPPILIRTICRISTAKYHYKLVFK